MPMNILLSDYSPFTNKSVPKGGYVSRVIKCENSYFCAKLPISV